MILYFALFFFILSKIFTSPYTLSSDLLILYKRARCACSRYASWYSFSGLWPLVRGKITSENGNSRNLRYTKNICHMILALITSESAHPIIQVEQLKQHFWHNSEICLLFSRKQQQIFTTCCWQYHIQNQRTRLP